MAVESDSNNAQSAALSLSQSQSSDRPAKAAAAENNGHANETNSGGVKDGYSSIDGIADKFRSHLILPVIDATTGESAWTALVPGEAITERGMQVDAINGAILSRQEWSVDDVVVGDIRVKAKIGQRGLLLSYAKTQEVSQKNTSVHLDESGSSANVSLVVRPDGTLEVHKTCSHDGIDENGRPWLERQNRFLETSVAVQETDIFVKPLRYTATDDVFSIDFPYLASQTLAQLAMAGMGGKLLLDITSDLMGEMAQKVWPKTATDSPKDFIEKAHFDRIDRRMAIARAAVAELGGIVDSPEITLNGRKLIGFHEVMKQLRNHPGIDSILPTLIGEIHGDLNLHNILCCVGESAQRQVALIDPRGVHLLSDFAKTRDFEPGDYAYELSKLKFSLSAFSEIRHGFLKLQGSGTDFKISFDYHSGSETMRDADAGFFDALSSNKDFMEWVKLVEPEGFGALRKRVLLGEAANFVADAACALGRDTVHEVIPLFLIGLDKLNSVLALLNNTINEHKLDDWFSQSAGEDTTVGVLAVQKALLRGPEESASWDVLEFCLPSDQVAAAETLLETLRGKCFTSQTAIYKSSSSVTTLTFPCILLHSVDSVPGSTNAVISGAILANELFSRCGLSDEKRDALRIVSFQSVEQIHGAASFARYGNRLFAPGPWGAAPLQLLLLAAYQLPFAQGGRWILDDCSSFLLSDAIKMESGDICVLTCAPVQRDTTRTAQVALSEAFEHFQTPVPGVQSSLGKQSAMPSGAMFLSTTVVDALMASFGRGVRSQGNLFTDVAFVQLEKEAWTYLYQALGFEADASTALDKAKALCGGLPPAPVSFASGGNATTIYRFSSLDEYRDLVTNAKRDPGLNSLAFLAATLAWREQWALTE